MTKNRVEITNKFTELFKGNPIIVEAPGRINLIGEHTDYNDGFVLPAAIDKKATFAIAPNNENIFRFFAADIEQHYNTKQIEPAPTEFSWANYLLGILEQFTKVGVNPSGIDCAFTSDIPIGAGLSSSAAIECGFALGLNQIFGAGFSRFELVKMAQKAEHEYANVMCGIMDQYASVFGKNEQVFRLDCRNLVHEYFPFEMTDYVIALCDTNVKHELASSEYNLRRKECEKGISILQQKEDGITALRDVGEDMLVKYKSYFDPITYKRCMYVVQENDRVLKAAEALKMKNIKSFGKLMYQSHEGLQKDYEVSCSELDILVEITRNMERVPGSRMMGGGFGGCTINLVDESFIKDFERIVITEYTKKTGTEPKIYFVNISDGARVHPV